TSAIKEVTVKPEKEHVSVKIAIVKTGTAEQMQLQSGIVKLVKELGAATVGLRCAEFTEEELAQFAPEQEEEQSESLLSPNSKTTCLAVA
ncbi:chromosome partitioning protein ParA, partial [Bacillus cereus]|nr:chromosome partitioning protein ParA [Bacillus cereus]